MLHAISRDHLMIPSKRSILARVGAAAFIGPNHIAAQEPAATVGRRTPSGANKPGDFGGEALPEWLRGELPDIKRNLALNSRTNRLALLLMLSIFTECCGWRRTMTFESPSHSSAVEIWQTGIANDFGTRVALVVDGRRTFVFENRRDALVSFVHVYWSPEERQASVLLSGLNYFVLAWDLRSGRPIPFESLRNDFARSIETTYRVPKGVDPFKWTGEAEAQKAFFALHPDIHLSYR